MGSLDVFEQCGQNGLVFAHDSVDLVSLLLYQFWSKVVGEFRFMTFSIIILGDLLWVDGIDTCASKALSFPGGMAVVNLDLNQWRSEDCDRNQLDNSVVGLNNERFVQISVDKDDYDFSIISRVYDSSFDR